MKERPIVFSAPTVRAIIEGRKTQTRRVIKPQPVMYDFGSGGVHPALTGKHLLSGITAVGCYATDDWKAYIHCPYGQPGDRLWVRETWCNADPDPGHHPADKPEAWRPRGPADEDGCRPWCYYRATDDSIVDTDACGWDETSRSPWRPSIHMPRWASRITLEVTSVRVQRLNEISEEDARAEGVDFAKHADLDSLPGSLTGPVAARVAFSLLWDSINVKRASWSSNPWVWVVEFRRINNER